MDEEAVRLIQLLLARLEHISVDSVWAHRASGIRGSLFKALETYEEGGTLPESSLDALTSAVFRILENVLRENYRRKTAH